MQALGSGVGLARLSFELTAFTNFKIGALDLGATPNWEMRCVGRRFCLPAWNAEREWTRTGACLGSKIHRVSQLMRPAADAVGHERPHPDQHALRALISIGNGLKVVLTSPILHRFACTCRALLKAD